MSQNSTNQPSGMDSIERLIERFKSRLRLQRSVFGAVEGACLGLMIAGVGVAAMSTGWANPDGWWIWATIAAAFTIAGAALRGLQPVDAISAAQTIDRTHDLHDRLSTAVSLDKRDDLSNEDTHFIRAQLQDALRYVETIDPRRAAPWRHPADTRLLAIIAISVIVFGLIPIPDHEHPLPEPFRATYGSVLDDATLELERDRLRELRRKIEDLPDDQAEQIADEIEALLDAVEKREISEREFLEAIDDIIERHFGDDTAERELDALEEALADAARVTRAEHAEAIEDHEQLQHVIDALDEGDFQKAADALSDFAASLDENELSPEEAERLADLMETFADQLEGHEERLQELFEENREAFEQLAEQFEDGSMEGQEDLLDDARNAMEEAQKESDEFSDSAARRQLEQLSRELDQTAQELRDQQEAGSPGGEDGEPSGESQVGEGQEGEGEEENIRPPGEREGAQDGEDDSDDPDYRNEIGRKMDDAARELQEMQNQRQRSEQREEARRQLEEMRESMSRSDTDEEGRDEQRGDQMRDFMERARGERSERERENNGEESEGEEGSEREVTAGDDAPEQGSEDENEAADGEHAGQGGPSGEPDEQGEAAEEMDAEYIREQLRGGESEEGRSRSEIIRGASEEGFSTIDYQDVYADYERIAEEVMEREEVPDGYRYYIKRYFQLIRPQQQ